MLLNHCKKKEQIIYYLFIARLKPINYDQFKRGNMKTCQIEGGKLRLVMLEKGMAQKELAEKIGVTHFNVSRWCRRGVQAVKKENLALAAKALNLTTDALIARCRVGSASDSTSSLSDAERDWLKVYQALSPLDQAKARIAIEDFASKKKA